MGDSGPVQELGQELPISPYGGGGWVSASHFQSHCIECQPRVEPIIQLRKLRFPELCVIT